MKALTIPILAHELVEGDYIAGRGLVSKLFVKGTVIANIAGDWRILPREERLTIHLEDYGGD